MFCGNCGAPLKEGAKFCPQCGTPVKTETLPEVIPAAGNEIQPVTPPAGKAIQAQFAGDVGVRHPPCLRAGLWGKPAVPHLDGTL